MSLIESGQVVKVEVIFKVPVGVSPGFDPLGWAMACVSVNGEGLRHMMSPPSAVLGSLKPNPSMLSG